MINEITSAAGARIKAVRKLLQKKYRDETSEFLIEGERFVREAAALNADIEEIYIRRGKKVEEFLNEFRDYDITLISEKVFDTISSTVNSQGIAARVKKPMGLTFPLKPGKYLYLDSIQDPGNLGTIIRSAHAFNMTGIMLSRGSCDVFSDKTLRSTMGSIFRVNIRENVTYGELESLSDFTLYVSQLENSGDIRNIKFRENPIIVIGNEGRGVSEEILQMKHENIRIEMPGGAESLNAAVAASIIMYQLF